MSNLLSYLEYQYKKHIFKFCFNMKNVADVTVTRQHLKITQNNSDM